MNLGGNCDNNTSGSAIVNYRGDELKLKDLHIGNWADYGIKFAPRETIGKIIIHDCIIYANENSQVLVTEDGGYVESLRVLDDWIMSQKGQIGMEIASGSGAENILMNGNLFTIHDLIRINGGSGINIVGNQFKKVASSYAVRFVDQGSATDFNARIVNNQFNASSDNPADYGVDVGDNCQGISVKSNKFSGFAKKAVNYGANTQVLRALKELGFEHGDILPLYSFGPNARASLSFTDTSYAADDALSRYDIVWNLLFPSGDYTPLVFSTINVSSIGSGETVSVRLRNTTDGETIFEKTGITSPQMVHCTEEYTPATTDETIVLKWQWKEDVGSNSSYVAVPYLVIGLKI